MVRREDDLRSFSENLYQRRLRSVTWIRLKRVHFGSIGNCHVSEPSWRDENRNAFTSGNSLRESNSEAPPAQRFIGKGPLKTMTEVLTSGSETKKVIWRIGN